MDAIEVRRKIKENRKRELEELTRNSKPLEQLLVHETFQVLSVIQQSLSCSHTPISEMRIGGKSPIYNTGYSTIVTMEVRPFNSIPVRTLVFNGISSVKRGDKVTALIPRYEKKHPLLTYVPENEEEVNRNLFYYDRPYKEVELAIELNILPQNSEDSTIARTERAVEYKNFV